MHASAQPATDERGHVVIDADLDLRLVGEQVEIRPTGVPAREVGEGHADHVGHR